MSEMGEHDLERVTAGKDLPGRTRDTLDAWRAAGESVARNGDRVGDAAGAVERLIGGFGG